MKPTIASHSPLQHPCRPFALVALAACSWANLTFAQDPAPSAAPATADAPAAPAAAPAGADAAGATSPAATSPAATEAPAAPYKTGESSPAGGASKKSPFAYDSGDTDAPKRKARNFTDTDKDVEQPAASGGGGDQSATPIVAPGFYGRAPQVITPGQGVYARPKYRYGISVGIGYDDNPNQTSTNLNSVATARARTGFTYLNAHFDAQWLKPTTVFTLNLQVGGDYYWDRPGKSTDANVRLGMLYVNKIDPRTQFTANASFAFLSQPDYSNLYASNIQNGGDYFTGSTKFDLSHRWSPLFTTVTSASVNLLKYIDEPVSTQSSSYWSFIFGNEFRFQATRRLVVVAEGRYEFDEYVTNKALDSQTAYALGGVDWIASRHLTATVRAGASFRTFDSGGSNTAPYVEMSLNYLVSRHSTLSLSGRYGFEQVFTAGDENLSYRLGLAYQQAFTSHFSGNAGINFIHTDYKPGAGARSSTDLYDLNVGFNYRFDRHFSVALRYAYTLMDSSTGLQNFDRNRVMLTAQYEY